jgi:hypothetical protein
MKSYEPYWTPAMVQAYLEDAADVMKALPRPRVQGYFSTWPDPVHDFWDAYGWTATENRWRPTARQISQMEYVCEWIRVVSVRDGKIIWRRACRVPWKVISSDLHTSRTAITNWYNFGIGQIVAHLNAQDPDGSLIKRQG